MTIATYDTYTLSRISAGVSGQAAINALNAPIIQAETALNNLSARIGALNAKSAVIRHYVPISSDVAVGTLVYYNNAVGHACFEPALASLLAVAGSNGHSIEAPCARVEGLIVAVDASGVTGTMLCGGYWKDSTVSAGCLGSSATAGTYYLSPTTAGKAVLDPGDHLQQAVLSYYGDGALNLNVFYMAHDNHFHGSAVLSQTWTDASAIVGVEQPEGATFGYNVAPDETSDDPALSGLGNLSNTTTSVFMNGVLQAMPFTAGSFEVKSGYLWTKLTTRPTAGSVTVFNHYPFAYGSPVVRSVASTKTSLTVGTTNGQVYITPNDFTDGSTTNTATAVATLSDNVIVYTPIVSSLTGGPGINVTRGTDGSAMVTYSGMAGSLLDAEAINHNGTAMASEGILQYILFPKSRTSEFIMQYALKDVDSATVMNVSAWCMFIDQGATLNVKMYFIAQPSASQASAVPTTPALQPTLYAAGESGKISLAETTSCMQVTGNGTLIAIVQMASAPSSDIKLLRTGFRVTPATTTVTDEDEPSATDVPTLKNTATAGYSASKYDIVYINSEGKLALCQSSVAARANSCVGIALSSCTVGEELQYAMAGIIRDTSGTWSFTAGSAIYVGTDGKIFAGSPPSGATVKFVQRIGTALTSSAIQLHIGTAILTGE